MNFTIKMPYYLPKVGYFKDLIGCDYLLFADHFQYTKRSAISRSQLVMGGKYLSIPVHHNGFKQSISEKEITYSEPWFKTHLKNIQHTYHMLPFYDEYYFKIQAIYKESEILLTKFLSLYTRLFLAELKINSKLLFTSQLNFSTDLNDDVINFAKNYKSDFLFNKKDINAGWIKIEKLKNNKIQVITTGNSYNVLDDLNILEFLFKYGPEASFKLREI